MDPSAPNPYAAPAALPQAPATALPRRGGPYGPYRDTRRTAAWLTILLAIEVPFILVRCGFNLAYVLSATDADYARVERVDEVFLDLEWARLIVVVVFADWIIRSAKNAWFFADASISRRYESFRVTGSYPRATPAWAVIWHFVPVAFLWKPYQAMRDIVEASTSPDRPGLPAYLLPTWWALWVGVMLVYLEQMSPLPFWQLDEDYWPLPGRLLYWTGCSALDLALTFFAYILVRSVTRLQTDTAAELAEAEEDGSSAGK